MKYSFILLGLFCAHSSFSQKNSLTLTGALVPGNANYHYKDYKGDMKAIRTAEVTYLRALTKSKSFFAGPGIGYRKIGIHDRDHMSGIDNYTSAGYVTPSLNLVNESYITRRTKLSLKFALQYVIGVDSRTTDYFNQVVNGNRQSNNLSFAGGAAWNYLVNDKIKFGLGVAGYHDLKTTFVLNERNIRFSNEYIFGQIAYNF